MSNLKLRHVQLGDDPNSSFNFTIMQPDVPDGRLIIARGNADAPGATVLEIDADGGFKTPQGVCATSVYLSAPQYAPAGFAKIMFDAAEFDTTNSFNFSTGRFQPTIPGYYQVNACVTRQGTSCDMSCNLYKNGTNFKYGMTAYGQIGSANLSTIVHLNGTDYLEVYGYMNVSQNYNPGAIGTNFNAVLLERT